MIDNILREPSGATPDASVDFMPDAQSGVSREGLGELLDAYPRDRRFALAIMQDMQRRYNYVPREGLEALAGRLGRPLAEMYGLATFYKALSLRPKGRRVIKVCDGTACHIRGSVNLIGAIGRELGIAPGETTADGEFSLELVNCLGACALAPVMVVGEKYYGKIALDALPGIFSGLRAEAGAPAATLAAGPAIGGGP